MIIIRPDYIINYKVVIIDNDDVRFKLKYKVWLKYNLFNILKFDDEIEIDEDLTFKMAKKEMIEIVKSFNKILN